MLSQRFTCKCTQNRFFVREQLRQLFYIVREIDFGS